MWNKLRRLAFLPVLLMIFGLTPSESEASHIMGGNTTYACINNCTIEVTFRTYRDCSGSNVIGAGPTFALVPGTGSCPLPTPLGPWSAQVTTEVTPICANTPTKCTNPSAAINGVEEFLYTRQYDICASAPCQFTMNWSNCCRNPAITTIPNPGSASIYIGFTTVNAGITPCNSSPAFAVPPVPYICNGQPYTFNQGAVDPDGDSLSYSLGNCYNTSGTTPLTYVGGASPTQPLGSTWNVSINASTGDITILPTPGSIQVGVLCVYVTEWRNGVAINTIMRDMQITVISCPNNTVPSIAGVTNVSGGIQNGPYSVTVCAGTQLNFNVPTTDPDVGQTRTLFWNQNLAGLGAQFYQNGTPSVQDTVVGNLPVGQFQWTPTSTGTYTVLFTVQDDACPIIGQSQVTVTINVIGGLLGSSAIGTPTGCTTVNFTASPGSSGTGPFTYQWSGDGNINQNPNNGQQSFNHTFPGPGTYNYQCIITDNFGCQSIIDSFVVINTGPTANGGPDISTCSNFPVQLGAPNIPGQTYTWVPNTGLNSANIAQPTFNMVNNTANPITVNYVVTASSGGCNAVDLVTVVVNPTPVASISGNLNICNGSSTTLTANGGTSYVWSNGATTPSITVSPTTTTTYTVTAIGNGCSSAPATATVVVSNGPAATVTGPVRVCPGDDATLTVVGGNAWQWSNGATTQTIVIQNVQGPTTVTVIPSNGGCPGPPVSYTVNLYDKPIADFNNTTVCEGLETDFNDVSTVATGNVVSWTWDFGDVPTGPNNYSATRNPSHTFSGPGVYNVELIVVSSNGCKDTISKSVTIHPLPTPDFTFEDVCMGEPMIFRDLSSGTGVGTWRWEFGDNTTSNQQNPTHNYGQPGAYNVTLTITDANGCSDSRTRTVFVHPNPVPDFSYVSTCFNTITTFTNLTTLTDPYGTEIGSYTWTFGDPASGGANTSNQTNPVHSYPGPGNYTVTLTVLTTASCQVTITRVITVAPIPPLTLNNDTVCRGYSGFLSVDNVPAGNIVEWYTTETAPQPFHFGRNLTTPPLSQTTVYWVDLYNPNDGCRSQRFPIFVKVWSPPQIIFEVQRELEIPNAIAEFNVTSVITPSTIASWYWTFGDGGGSTEMNPVHQYTDAGVYTVTLHVVDANGCETFYELKDYITVTQNIGLWVPNAFSPNDDGNNDEFKIVTRLITSIDISIFDRWGKVIYQSQDPNFKWEGKYGGVDLPEGVYAYKINAVTYDGSKFEKAGSIMLIR